MWVCVGVIEWEQLLRLCGLWTVAHVHCPEKHRTFVLSILPPGPGDNPKRLVRAVAPPYPNEPAPSELESGG